MTRARRASRRSPASRSAASRRATGRAPAQKAGLEAGDIIVAADGKPVDRVSTLQRIVRTHLPGQTIALEVVRFGTGRRFDVKLSEAPSDEQIASSQQRTGKAPARE